MTEIKNQRLENWAEKFKAGEIHLVCLAIGGLTICDSAAYRIGGMDQKREVWPLTRRVNRLGETGTFHPNLPLTVVPLLSWEDRPARDDVDGFLRTCFEDVAKANREYIKLDTLYVNLSGRPNEYPVEYANRIAAEVLELEASIETIYFEPNSAATTTTADLSPDSMSPAMISICPVAYRWAPVYKELQEYAKNHALEPPPKPLILAAWAFSSDLDKQNCWQRTVAWAELHGCPEIVRVLNADFYKVANPSDKVWEPEIDWETEDDEEVPEENS